MRNRATVVELVETFSLPRDDDIIGASPETPTTIVVQAGSSRSLSPGGDRSMLAAAGSSMQLNSSIARALPFRRARP